MTDPVVKTSKFLSLVLRHNPDKLGIELDSGGWANIDELLRKMAERGRTLSRTDLEHVVENNNKKRFAISEDGQRIRASQGHSIPVDLGLTPCSPPETLFHGTADRNEKSIVEAGLSKQARQHVHLSANLETAIQVGTRHGKPIVFEVLAEQMHEDGHAFYQSANGVWLTDHVPPQYLRKLEP